MSIKTLIIINMPHSTALPPNAVEAFLEYYAPNPDGSLPDANDLEVQYGKKNLDLHPVTVGDMRAHSFTLQNDGIQLVNHESKMIDFTDPEKVKKNYLYKQIFWTVIKCQIWFWLYSRLPPFVSCLNGSSGKENNTCIR